MKYLVKGMYLLQVVCLKSNPSNSAEEVWSKDLPRGTKLQSLILVNHEIWGLSGKANDLFPPLPSFSCFHANHTGENKVLKITRDGVEEPYTMNGMPVRKLAARHAEVRDSSVAALVG